MQMPTAPPSPFPYAFGHNRIRTDSLCSMKSNRDITVANLQPRKNIRTEDQKIQDQKKESRERLSNKDLDKSQLRMFDMIYFNPLGNPMKQRSPNKSGDKQKKPEINLDMPEETFTPPAAVAVPQLRLNANGEMVLDETSLVIESEQQKQNRNALATSNVVYDDDLSGNYGYYKRQQRTKEWPQEETVKFYRCLNTVGTDFSLMLNLFPNRTRRDLKLKFKKEEKNNPHLIDKAVLKHSTFDLDNLKKDLDTEEEERRKAADLKSEVKQLVKLKILKRQEAKMKSRTKIEKVLSEDFPLSCYASKKENFNVPVSRGIFEMSQPKKPKSEESATSVMDIFEMKQPKKPVKRPRQKASSLGEDSNVVKKQRKKRPAVVIEQATTSKDVKKEVPSHVVVHETEAVPEVPTVHSPAKTATLQPFNDHKTVQKPETVCEIDKMQDMATTADSHKSSDTFSIQNSEALQAPTSDITKAVMNESSTQNSEADTLPSPTSDITKIVMIESSIQNADDATQSPTADISKTVMNESPSTTIVKKISAPGKKPKARKGKYKPTLVTRLKLQDGEMVLDELPIADAASNDTHSTENMQVPVKGEPSQDSVDENLNETNVFDDQAFLNNLDLETLVLVQATRDGGDVFEIHEINPVTQEISEIPLDLPARYFDLIISVMTSQDEEE